MSENFVLNKVEGKNKTRERWRVASFHEEKQISRKHFLCSKQPYRCFLVNGFVKQISEDLLIGIAMAVHT